MIEKMKMVYIITTASRKGEMLRGLRDLGAVHIAEKQNADRDVSERFQTMSNMTAELKNRFDPKKQKDVPESMTEEEFAKVYADVKGNMDRKAALEQEISSAESEISRTEPWGDFSPADVAALRDEGFDLHFYRLMDKDYQEAVSSEDVKLFRLGIVEKQTAVATIGALPGTIQAVEFVPPAKSISEFREDIEEAGKEIEGCDARLDSASVYSKVFRNEQTKLHNELKFSEADATVKGDDDFVWLSGYLPEAELDSFKAMASENGCAWAAEDVAEDDEKIPTKLRYTKVSKLIKPIYDILEIQPGYREQDVSLWFFLFFTLFFAMIIGDGGYGFLILIATIALHVKQKKAGTGIFLLYILSGATIAWGAVTGTWFGIEAAMNVPLLHSLVIPSIATYPDYFDGVTSNSTQYAVMKFSLSIGVVQLVLGTLLSIKKKFAEKNLSWVADAGWTIANIAMYVLALNLVIGEDIALKPVFIAIGAAFVLVVIFGGMEPDKTFAQGLKAGLANAFTSFLDTISCFGNVMSYIRLFAVGMAGVAISQSFNDIGSSLPGIWIIAGAVIILLGHALNIAMCFLSVAVHGVRLNVLEFSGQAGIEWAGIPYEPFKELDK